MTDKKKIEEFIRVDHAGEYAAVRIYQGQLAVLKETTEAPLLKEMLANEEEHLSTFNELLTARNVRPSVLLPLWDKLSYGLGFFTAMMGVPSAMAATVAVESVIDKHYEDQEKQIGADDKELKDYIKKFRQDEIEHHNQAMLKEAEKAPFYPILSKIIKNASRCAIKLSEKF